MKRLAILLLVFMFIFSAVPLGVSAEEDNPTIQAKSAVVCVVSGIYFENGKPRTYHPENEYGSGTCFGVGPAGQAADTFITNCHVTVMEDSDIGFYHECDFVYLCLDSSNLNDESTMVKCDVVYRNAEIDFAILKSSAPVGGVSTLPLVPAESTPAGSDIYVMGYPGIENVVADNSHDYTIGGMTITDGVISRFLESDGVKCFSHTAKSNSGNSGGPVINKSGQVVGIHTFSIADPSTIDRRTYAIYIDYVIDKLKELNIPFVEGSAQGSDEPATSKPADSGSEDPSNAPSVGGTTGSGENDKGGLDLENKDILLIVGVAAVAIILVAIVIMSSKKKNSAETSVSSSPVTAPAAAPVAAPVPATAPVSPYCLCITAGGLTGRSWSLSDKLTIGRNSTCDIVFPADTKGVSRDHCRVELRGDSIVLVDLGSSQGTFVNGQRLSPNVPVKIHENTVVSLGSDHVTFVIKRS